MNRLLFVLYNQEGGTVDHEARRAESFEGFARNFTSVWQKFPLYSVENTVMVSNYLNKIDEFHRNDLILPLFDPMYGHTDFTDDKHLAWVHSYITFLAGVES